MKPNRAWIAVSLLAAALPVCAKDLNQLQTLSQSEFKALSEDLGAALSYKPLTPTEPLGVTGFDVGLAVTATRLKHADLFDRATSSGSFPSTLAVPTLRASKGLPLNFDASLMFSAIPHTSIKVWGGALSYALVPGDVALPAIGVRASYTKLFGVNQLEFNTAGVDLSASKGFALFTPYAGLGRVWATSTPTGGVVGLNRESFWLNKYFAGLNFKLGAANLAMEWDRTGRANSYGAKLGVRF